MIYVLDTLPTIYFWLYVGLAVSFLGMGVFRAMHWEKTGKFFNAAVVFFFATALGTHLFHFFTRWSINGHAPLQSKHEIFIATGMTMMLFALVLYLSERVWRLRGAPALLGSLIFVAITGMGGILWTGLGMKESYKVHNLVPALQSYWHPPHVSAYMLGYGSLGIAAVLAIVYLIGAAGTRFFGGPRGGRPALAGHGGGGGVGGGGGAIAHNSVAVNIFQAMCSPTVERWTHKIATLGFPFMTAALCMGALWADESWGTYWFWDPKETWAFISWATFLTYFHVRFIGGWKGVRAQAVVAFGGFMILITYLLIAYLPAAQGSLHVYN